MRTRAYVNRGLPYFIRGTCGVGAKRRMKAVWDDVAVGVYSLCVVIQEGAVALKRSRFLDLPAYRGYF